MNHYDKKRSNKLEENEEHLLDIRGLDSVRSSRSKSNTNRTQDGLRREGNKTTTEFIGTDSMFIIPSLSNLIYTRNIGSRESSRNLRY